jgi:hypothetical protein
MAVKLSPTDVLSWINVVMTLVTVGATTVAKVKLALIDAGWPEDDARLVALDAEYARRLARRKAEA